MGQRRHGATVLTRKAAPMIFFFFKEKVIPVTLSCSSFLWWMWVKGRRKEPGSLPDDQLSSPLI